MPYAILYDSTRCIECRMCVDACRLKWDLPKTGESRLSENAFTILENRNGHPIRRMCMHCLEPACASVCPVGALEKTENGPVVYHADRCMGCRYCMMACPFGVPKYEWSSAVPRVRKCVMCFDRIDEGKKPACTMVCPEDAIRFGEREELLAEAHARLRAEPGRYHPHVYGEREAGGTSVLVIASVPPGELGLPSDLPEQAMPERTWQVLSRLPGVVVVGAAFCTGMWWLINSNKIETDRIGPVAVIRRRDFEKVKKKREESQMTEEDLG